MKELCENIDQYIKDNLSCPGFKFFGLAELALKGKQPHPVTVNTREQVAINDKFDGIVYHRVLTIPSNQDLEFSFGKAIVTRFNTRIRTLLAFKVAKFKEEFVFDFANALPQTLTVIGYDLIDINENVTIIVDQKAVYEQEFGENNYEKHILPWNIYAIEHDVEFIKCP